MHHRWLVITHFVVYLALAAMARAQGVPPQAFDGEIVHLRGDVYHVRAGNEHTVLLLTSEGIILVDTLGVAAAQWLQRELAERFPEREVRFVLYTHHHADRAAGTRIFSKIAEIVGHRQFNDALADSRRGASSQAYGFVGDVESTYEDRRAIALGGSGAELVHTGPFHSRDMSVVWFPAERLLFAADAPPIRKTPFSFSAAKPRDVIRWLKTVAQLEFDMLLFDDGTSVSREEVSALAAYLDWIRTEVTLGYQDGRSLSHLQANLRLDAFGTYPQYLARATHIAEVYRTIQMVRLEMTVAGLTNHARQNPVAYCESYTFCSAGGMVPAGSISVSLRMGRRFGVVGELTLGEQWWSARSKTSYDDEVAFRQSRGSVFLLFGSPSPRGFSYALLGGLSNTIGDARGQNRVQGVLVPTGGRHLLEARANRYGVSGGVDLSQHIGRGVRVVLPLRLTRAFGDGHEYWPDRVDVQAGVGISVRVLRSVGEQ
jgi:glyoxylase-like metal-dependent hydrolase (beta-lactamase superfamily II)